MTVAGVLLAAGRGSRLGGPKAAVELGGTTLLERGVGMLTEAGCEPVAVVVGADAAVITTGRDLGRASVVVNREWATGQASSLAVGLGHLHRTNAGAAVVALVDQPFVSAAAVRRLVQAWRTTRVPAVAASYGGEPRNPVLLDRAVWQDVVAAARPDEGARSWLRAHRRDVLLVVCDDVASPFDIDTPDDLAAARAHEDGPAAG